MVAVLWMLEVQGERDGGMLGIGGFDTVAAVGWNQQRIAGFEGDLLIGLLESQDR